MAASKRQSQKFLVILNIGHIVIGFLSLVFALLQFSPIGLDNAAYVDFRLLNLIHAITGSVGLHMVAKNFGSVVAKTLYCLSLTLALWTLAFYADTLGQEITQYESIREIRRMDGGEELIDDELVRNHGGKLAVCSLMILISLVECAFSVASLIVLERLASDTYSNLRPGVRSSHGDRKSPQHQSLQAINRRRQMAFVALMKIFFSLTVVVLGAYLEYMYKRRSKFIKIGWQELTGAIAFASACVDLHALYGRTHNLLNLKISLIMSVITAVLSLKTLDYNMSNYFVLDVREYSRYDELKSELQQNANQGGVQMNTEGDKKDAFVKFLIHASIIGSLALIFAHSVISAVEASSYIEWGGGRAKANSSNGIINVNVVDGSRILGGGGGGSGSAMRYAGSHLSRTGGGGGGGDDESDDDVFEYDETLHRQKSCAGILQCVWGLALVALCVISLVSWDFSRGYDGGAGVLWLGCLFIASGLINASRPKTFTTSVYVLSVISLVLAFERAIYSLNVIYQAVRNPRFSSKWLRSLIGSDKSHKATSPFADELDPSPTDPARQKANYDAHIGRITLYAVEAGVLVLEFLTATWTAVKVTQAIRSFPRPTFHTTSSDSAPLKGPLCSLGFFHLLYAFVTIAVSVAAEVAMWGSNVHVSYLVYMTNGVIVFAAVFVQWMASQQPQFLLCSGILNVVTASVAFFVISPAVRDLYTLVANYRSVYEGKATTAATDANGGALSEMLDAERRGKPIQEWIIGLNALILLLAIVEYVVSVVSGMICSYLLHHAYDPMTSDLRFSTLRSQPPNASQISHYWSPNGNGGGIQPPSVITTAKYDPIADNGRLSRRHSHSSLAAVEGMMGSKVEHVIPERYFGGTNDFRVYGHHQNQHASNTSTMPASNGLRRTNDLGTTVNNGYHQHPARQTTGSVPSLLYAQQSSNGAYSQHHHQQQQQQHPYTSNSAVGNNGTRVNGYTQTNLRHAFPTNGSYMTSYT